MTVYIAVLFGFVTAIWLAAAALGERHATVRAAETLLAQIEGRLPSGGKPAGSAFDGAPAGSPFLEGQTLTVAGATLLQRIAGSVSRIGGHVLSSQVELQKADAAPGWIGLIVSCEIEQAALQALLYDLEAGMPFLFIEQLTIHAPVAAVENSRMRILLAVSGLWGGQK